MCKRQVVRARHKSSGRMVALKRVWQNSGGGFGGGIVRNDEPTDGRPETMLREAQALQAVRHPNVVQLHRTFQLVRIASHWTSSVCAALRKMQLSQISASSYLWVCRCSAARWRWRRSAAPLTLQWCCGSHCSQQLIEFDATRNALCRSQRSSLAMEMECCATDVAVVLRAARARNEQLPEPVARELLRQLLTAIAACHAAGAACCVRCNVFLSSAVPLSMENRHAA